MRAMRLASARDVGSGYMAANSVAGMGESGLARPDGTCRVAEARTGPARRRRRQLNGSWDGSMAAPGLAAMLSCQLPENV